MKCTYDIFKGNSRFFIGIVTTFILLLSSISYADLIPAENSSLYYRVGGGQDIPMPANVGAVATNLSVGNNLSMGYNCGSFSPSITLTNTLNDVKNSFENIDNNIVSRAQSAIASFAMYELARADPNAYNLLNNNLIGAHNLFSLNMSSCQTMQNDAAKGVNPFTDWVTVSMGNDWKSNMLAATQPNPDPTSVDLNQATQKIAQDNGSNGVPWVGGTSAGGAGQSPINVMNDTAIAGYNVLIGNRADNDSSAPTQTPQNAHLVSTWATPSAAANWIVNVVGDEQVATCSASNCPAKGATPGLGLLPSNQTLATTITTQLQNLVTGSQTPNLQSLQAVSAPGVAVNMDVIRALQNMNPQQQAIMIGKLGQDVATAQTIDQALLAKRILVTGSHVPEIYSNHAAQRTIQRGIGELDQDMQNLLFDIDTRRKVVSNTITDILQDSQSQASATQTTPTISTNAPPFMQDGAVMSNPNQASTKR